MLVLTADRLICVTNPLKYKMRMTRGRLKTILATSWIVSLCLGVTRGVTKNQNARKYITVSLYVIGILYVVFAVFTYSYIVIALRTSRQRFRCVQCSIVRKDYLLPGLIISSFVLLGYIPYMFIHFSYHQLNRTGHQFEPPKESLGYNICDLLPTCLCLVDALLYIFVSNRYRRTIMRMLCSTIRRPDDSIYARSRYNTSVFHITHGISTSRSSRV